MPENFLTFRKNITNFEGNRHLAYWLRCLPPTRKYLDLTSASGSWLQLPINADCERQPVNAEIIGLLLPTCETSIEFQAMLQAFRKMNQRMRVLFLSVCVCVCVFYCFSNKTNQKFKHCSLRHSFEGIQISREIHTCLLIFASFHECIESKILNYE